MKIISTKMHAVLDYGTAALLIIFPYVFIHSENPAASWVLVGVGVLVLVISLMTRYEGGMMGMIPMPVHLAVDVITGIFLVASPWLLGFAEDIYLPHVMVGIFSIGAGLLTRSIPSGAY